MKIDIFAHFLPRKYFDRLLKKAKNADFSRSGGWMLQNPALSNIDVRLKVMDRYPDVLQVLTVATPPMETLVGPKDAAELAQIANDEMAELVARHPDRFVAAVACLPLKNIDAALKEADRAITKLHMRGAQVFTNVNGEMLDAREFRPLYEKMVHHDLPLWIHPVDPLIMRSAPKGVAGPIQNWINHLPMGSFIWPFETALTMLSLVNAGTFIDFPTIKFITHHCGGMVPFFERRIKRVANAEHLHKFYNDTAVYGNTSALMCGYDYFGPDRLLFGTDMPLGATGQGGYGYTWDTVRSVEQMSVPDADKTKIFEENTRKLLRLTI
ncbi:MAG TPA: amidohydrolase family protein [Syntrophorhabdaceae bacterium]|nr:amidohydrolase family protein [Syntrophorhabdaceae bacterium]